MAYEDNLKEFIDKHRDRLEAKQNGEDDLQREFTELKSQALKVKQGKATTAGEKQSNFRKNRYKDILPFDETRFVLKATETSPDGYDYINASYVKGVNENHAYIAAQGPLPTTVNDFWRLLWESGGSVIIMACNEYELGKNKTRQDAAALQHKHKCERYWAEEGETKQFDDISVTLVDSDCKKRDYKERTLKACKGREEKIFHQFHYTAWPDHGVPDTVSPILELRHKARKLQPQEDKPLIIHCSAGCGRTGTIMVLDYVAELIKKKEVPQDFSVFKVIMDMRKQRPAIVQTKDQYEFVHRAISELFKHELSTLGMDYGHNYVNVQIGVPPAVAKKAQPRMPPGLPSNTSTTAKPRPTSGDKSIKPPPPQKPNDTVYANAADVQSLANPPQQAPSSNMRRNSSSREVVQSLASSANRQDPPSKVPLRPKVAAKKERLSDIPLHSSNSNPPPQKLVIPPAIKNITMQVSPAAPKHSPLHKPGQFDTIRDNLNQTLSNTNVKANPPVRDRPNYTPPKPPQKGPNAPLAVSKQDDSHRTRSKVQSASNSDYDLVTPIDSGRSPRGPGKPRNAIPRRPSSDSNTSWKESSLLQSGDGFASSDNLPGMSEFNVSYQSAEPPAKPPANPPPRPPPQQRHEYEPVSITPKPSPPAKPSTDSSSEYDLVAFQSNGPHSPTPVLGQNNGGILTTADSSHSHTAYNSQSRSNRSSAHISRTTPPVTKSTGIGSNFALSPSNQDPETDQLEDGDDSIPAVPARTVDSYIIVPTDDVNDKHLPQDKAQQSGGLGTLRVVQRRLQNTREQLTKVFNIQSDDGNSATVPRPAPPQSQNQHNGPRPFPHRNAKPNGPRPRPPHMKHPQTGKAHIGVIPMN